MIPKLITISVVTILINVTFSSASELTITSNDQMQFSVKEFEVQAGEDVEIVFKNVGKLPKIAMGHNLVILQKGVSAIAFGGKAAKAGANAINALPESVLSDVLISSKLLGPGESEMIRFKAPSDPGVHQFLCSFPGHYAIMRGLMIVK